MKRIPQQPESIELTFHSTAHPTPVNVPENQPMTVRLVVIPSVWSFQLAALDPLLHQAPPLVCPDAVRTTLLPVALMV